MGNPILDEDGKPIYIDNVCLVGNSHDIRNELKDVCNIYLFQDGAHLFHDHPVHQQPGKSLWDDTSFPIENENEPSPQIIVEYMKKAGFYSWHGHGSPHGIACGYNDRIIYGHSSYAGKFPFEYISVDNSYGSIDMIANGNKPAILYSIACDLAPFDYLEEYWSSHGGKVQYLFPNIGRQFTTESSDYGGVAALVNTRSGTREDGSKLESNVIQEIIINPCIGIAMGLAKIISTDDNDRWVNNLIGEPEFKMWLGRPKDMKLNLKPSATGYEITGAPADSISLLCSNGNTAKLMSSNTYAGSYTNPFTTGEYTVSLWKSGYLPLITLFAQSGMLNEYKRYVVRNAVLGSGSDNLGAPSYSVGESGRLSIRAIDNVETRKGFIVKSGGMVDISCDQEVYLYGGTV